MKKVFVSIIAMLLPLLASADAVEIDGICYSLNLETKQAEVTKNPDGYSGDVTIPNTVTYEKVEYSVASIIDQAFQTCNSLTSITIPNSITSFVSYAFSGCSGLTSITIPQNVTSIGVNAFYGCSGLIYVTLPSNLTSIGWSAFKSCKNLTDIYCEAVNVPSANSDAFSNPENITLHVPYESLNAYQTTEPWNIFKSYESLSSSASEKCSKPTISIVDGKFVFNCETQFVDYHWSISTSYGNNGIGGSVSSLITLNVFATKYGYLPSDVATYEFSGLAGDVNNDGVVNVADHVKLSEIIMDQK